MADKKDYTLIALSAVILATLGLNVMPEPNYQCDSRELLAYCFDVSSTGKTCYTLPEKQAGKRCTEGWIETFTPKEFVDTGINVGQQYHCDTEKCVEIP